MYKRNEFGYEDKESFSPWKSYSDLYCGLLLVFALLFFFSIYQLIAAREANVEEQTAVLALYKADAEDQEAEYKKKSEELDKTLISLNVQKEEAEKKNREIEEKTQELEKNIEEMNQKDAELKKLQASLENREAAYQTKSEELEDARSSLNSQEVEIRKAEAALEEKNKEISSLQNALEDQAAQLELIIGVREKLIEDLNREMRKNNIQVEADMTTGAIIFPSNVLFQVDSNELSESGKDFFRKFMPVYLNVLFQPEYKESLAEIIVEGHTDDTGTYMHNLELSERRAHSVAEFCVRDNCDFLDLETVEKLRSYITVNGCAYKMPILAADGTMDRDKSRRVEIKFRLRDEEMIEAMDEILKK